jgi:hypothetical protein
MDRKISEACVRMKLLMDSAEFEEFESKLKKKQLKHYEVNSLAFEYGCHPMDVWALLLESCGMRKKCL